MTKDFIVEDSGERDDDCRYYGLENFIIGYRFEIIGLNDKAINSYEIAIDYINRISEKTKEDTIQLENYRIILRDIIKGKTKDTPSEIHIITLKALYDQLSDIWIKKISPNMRVNGEKLSNSYKDVKKLFMDSHKKITGEIIKPKWK